MADRLYEKEGLRTSRNRDREANMLSTRIVNAQNHVYGRTDGNTVDETGMYDGVADLVGEMTRNAWANGDSVWRQDMRAIIRYVVAIYGGTHKKPLKDKLLARLDEIWKEVSGESAQHMVIGNIAAGIKDVAGRARAALGNFEQWAKKQ